MWNCIFIKDFLKQIKWNLSFKKARNFGFSQFVPVIFQRSIVKLTEKDVAKKTQRWQKIAEVAAKQSKRDCVPMVKNPIFVKEICDLVPEYDSLLLAYEEETRNTIKKELKDIKNTKEKWKIAVVIGPEGGITKEEVETLKKVGAKVISLGRRILRTETVALQVASIIMYELEE